MKRPRKEGKSGDSASLVKLVDYLRHPDRESFSVWSPLCPGLLIGHVSGKRSPSIRIKEETGRIRRRELIEQGFTLCNDSFDCELISKLRKGIEELEKLGLPASLILLFDEAWQLAELSRHSMAQMAHAKNSFNFDLLAWFIKPGTGGFSPHRDRQPVDATTSFHPDGQAKMVTQWIALSDATPTNSCLYMVPRSIDPGYMDGDNDDEDPLRRALSTKECYQKIRAIPRKAGESVVFTHRIIHWGSQAEPDCEPRIAISFVCSDESFEAPLISQQHFANGCFPAFKMRLLLVCAQLLIYYQRFDLDRDTIKECYCFCKSNESDLSRDYREKVFVEFVKAMKDESVAKHPAKLARTSIEEPPLSQPENPDESEGDHGDDDDDKIMEEMLNAEEGGYGEFEDDYDEIVEDSKSR